MDINYIKEKEMHYASAQLKLKNKNKDQGNAYGHKSCTLREQHSLEYDNNSLWINQSQTC